jgi:ubiquinone/menaquinone biosynthesis C-methylase UbiE
MPVIDHLLASARLRQALWKFWYPYLTRRLRADDVIFLNYAFEDDASAALALNPADEPNRACIQLYHHVAAQAELRGKKILEVSCGHGGGASYLTRTFLPASYTGLDLNAAGIAFCQQRHRVDGLTFLQGDAQNLPFADAAFDAVINVEASHCYPDFPRFLAEVFRVLRPGGDFLCADFRFRPGVAEWENAIASAPFRVRQTREINREVLRGMDRNSARSAELILRHLPRFLHGLGRDFAGVQGSRVYIALRDGEASYRSWHFQKPSASV